MFAMPSATQFLMFAVIIGVILLVTDERVTGRVRVAVRAARPSRSRQAEDPLPKTPSPW